MKEELDKIKGNKKKLLLHTCCGPCSTATLEKLLPYFDITIYFSNSNIDTKEEFDKRLQTQRAYIKKKNLNIDVICDEYNHDEFLKEVKGLEDEIEGGKRCKKCIEYRLKKAIIYAKNNHFEYVTTSLTISPHKNATLINELGEKLCKDKGIIFLYSDFKKDNGFLKSIELSKEYNLYRQNYCGCEFSK